MSGERSEPRADAREFEVEAPEAVTGGVRHAAERRQQREWRARAGNE